MSNKYAIEDVSNKTIEVPLALPYAELSNPKNNKKVKIATVQPGLEEMSMVESANSTDKGLKKPQPQQQQQQPQQQPQEQPQQQPKKRRLFKTPFSSSSGIRNIIATTSLQLL